MKCTVCKNGTCKKGITSTMFDKKGTITIFKQVPAMICDNCGAKFFDAKTSASLLKLARLSRKNGSELEVLSLKAA